MADSLDQMALTWVLKPDSWTLQTSAPSPPPQLQADLEVAQEPAFEMTALGGSVVTPGSAFALCLLFFRESG